MIERKIKVKYKGFYEKMPMLKDLKSIIQEHFVVGTPCNLLIQKNSILS